MKIAPILAWACLIIVAHILLLKIKRVYLINDELKGHLLNALDGSASAAVGAGSAWNTQAYPQLGPIKGWSYNAGGMGVNVKEDMTSAASSPPNLEAMKKELIDFVNQADKPSVEAGFPDRVYSYTTPFETKSGRAAPRKLGGFDGDDMQGSTWDNLRLAASN